MSCRENVKSSVMITYTDPVEGFNGYLAIDSNRYRIAAGGFQVQLGLTAEKLNRMAHNMTLKQQVGGIKVDGAKCGIDYDPKSPGRTEAMKRFLTAIKPYLKDRYSMGADLNTTQFEIDSLVKSIDLPAAKIAIAKAQGLKHKEFMYRYEMLYQEVGGVFLGRRRAGHGVAMAALAVLDLVGVGRRGKVVIQGFGSLGRAAALSLYLSGVKIIAVADRDQCIIAKNPDRGLNIKELWHHALGTLLPKRESPEYRSGGREEIYAVEADAFLPCAIENAVDEEKARDLPVKVVATGANLALSREAEAVFFERGVMVVPDFVAGAGGSISMDGLFGIERQVSPQKVLDHVEQRMRQIVTEIMSLSRKKGISPRKAACQICKERDRNLDEDMRPYGHPLPPTTD
ncbi:MAG: Glu/Leu/Phe/Val dehydrogenase dimerization domain-containing protein [bacterium]